MSPQMSDDLFGALQYVFQQKRVSLRKQTEFDRGLRHCLLRSHHHDPVSSVNYSTHGPDSEFVACAIEAPKSAF